MLAECITGLIADTKRDCAAELETLAKIAPPPPGFDAWIRAGCLRNPRDWRKLDKPERASGLEQVEYFRAVGEAVDINKSVQWMDENNIPAREDWPRLVLQATFPSKIAIASPKARSAEKSRPCRPPSRAALHFQTSSMISMKS